MIMMSPAVVFHQLVLLVIFFEFKLSGGFKFHDEMSTIGKQNTWRGSTFWFNWNFTLDSATEGLISFDCGFNDTAANKLIPLAIKTGSSDFEQASSIPASYNGRVKVFSSNYTFAVHRLEFSDERDYYCQITYNLNTSSTVINKTVDSAIANLKVKGPAEFCAPNPSLLSVNSGEKANVTVTVCGNGIAVFYRWSDYLDPKYKARVPGKIGINKYQDSFVINAKKDLCGIVFSVYPMNSYGRPNTRNVTLNVLFDPSKPSNIQAFKANKTCYKVQWTPENTGNCVVNYTMDLKDASGVSKWKRTVDARIKSVSWCSNITTNITDLDIKVDTLKSSQTYSVKLMPTTPNPTTRPTSTSNPSNSGWTLSKQTDVKWMTMMVILMTMTAMFDNCYIVV